MKTLLAVMLLGVGFAGVALAATDADRDVVLLDHAKVDAMFAKGGPLYATKNFKIMAGRRDGPGEVEIHTKDTDIFYVTEGSATIITGGTAVDPKEVSPGEIRAKSSKGGVTRHLAKGDVIVIPAGVAHWMPETSKPFVYFVVKVTN